MIGFDDAPFERSAKGKVALVGTVCSGTRLDVVVRGYVEQDGDDATRVMAELVRDKALVHVRAVLMKGITVAGFNVIDINALSLDLGMPVLVVMRKPPKLDKFYDAMNLLPNADSKRQVVESAGPIEECGGLWVQRAGLSLEETATLMECTTLHGMIPEPLRLAHIIAGGTTRGISRGRA